MSVISRRGLFGLFAGAMATPVLGKLAMLTPDAFAVAPKCALSLSDIVAITLRARSAKIVESMYRTNPLLAALAASR